MSARVQLRWLKQPAAGGARRRPVPAPWVPGPAGGRQDRGFPGGISLLYALIGAVVLAVATVVVGGIGPARSRRPVDGALAGAVAGLVMGGFTMFVAAPALDLPWHAPPRGAGHARRRPQAGGQHPRVLA